MIQSAPRDLIADDADQRVDAVGLLGALRDAHLGGEAARGVAAGGDDRARRHEHARSGHDTLVDRLLDADVSITRPLGAEVANRREAGPQRVACMVRGPAHPQRQRFLEHLVIPRRLVVRMQQHMRVRVDKPRQQRGAGQRDAACARRHGDLILGPHGIDFPAAHHDDPAGMSARSNAIVDASRPKHDHARRLAGSQLLGERRRGVAT